MNRKIAALGAALLAVAGIGTAVVVKDFTAASGPFSFQAAYNSAANGAVIEVPNGTVVVDQPPRASATIFGATGSSAKAVTFTCQDPNGVVTTAANAPLLTIKASNITIDGPCFQMINVRVGEGGDTTLTASNVLIEDAYLLGSEVVGADNVTFLRDKIGPNISCYAQGKTGNGVNGGAITPKMWCDPNGPPYEAKFATTGTDKQRGFETYIHNNSGRASHAVLYKDSWITGDQSKDAFNMHPGGPLVWNTGAASVGNVTFQNDRIDNNAVEGILSQATNGILIDNVEFGPAFEPYSNTLNAGCTTITDPCANVLTAPAQKELIAKSGSAYANWLVKGSAFCHGTRADGATSLTNITFDSNDLGIANAPFAGATYTNNVNKGAGCSLPPMVWPPGGGGTTSSTTTTETTTSSTTSTTTSTTTTTEPPPPPTSHCPDGGTSLALSLLSSDATTVTLGWTPPPATRAYLFSRQGYVKPDGSQRFPSSLNPALAQVTFAKADWYCVEALSVAKDGGYP